MDRSEAISKIPPTPWGMLPTELHVPLVTENPDMEGWLFDAFSADRVCKVKLEEAANPLYAIDVLRDVCVDAVLVSHDGVGRITGIEK